MKILDKEEFRIKLEEINRLVEEKDYKGAMNVVDSIDWRRVKNVRTLCVVGEIYAANKRYEDSREIFLLAYHRAPIGKNILYRLIEISLKLGSIEDAMEFYEEFKTVAPNDNTQYILKYKIYKAKKASLNEQIAILEEYKEKEFTEKWSYELAMLYYQAGEKDKCLELCNEIILWFSEGGYVMKALDLKMRMGVLTGEEKEKYEQQFVPKLLKPEDMKEIQEQKEGESELTPEEPKKEEPVIETIKIRNERDLEGTETLQEKISKGIRDIFGGKKKEDEGFDEEENAESVQEEMIKDISKGEEFANVPDLEKEDEKLTEKAGEAKKEKENAADLSKTMKMPELNIPKSMKNMELQESLEVNGIADKEDKAAVSEEAAEEKEFDFNLEDTILAAASAQGIEIPTESEADTTMDDLEADPMEEPLEEEEEFTEEDLAKAEEEFLNGPSKGSEPAVFSKKEKIEIPDLEEEDLIENKQNLHDVEESEEDEDFILRIMKENEDEEDPAFEEKLDLQEEEDEPEDENLSEEEKLERFIDSIQPEDDTNPFDIVPRERTLREEEKQLFTYFVKVPGMREQLLDTLCDAQMAAADKTSKTGNIVVMGGRETGKTRLISSLIPAICKELNLEASRVAYVFADQINGRDIKAVFDKLAGGFLVIENANQLDQETAENLDKAMEGKTDGLTVILEDEKIGMRKMLARYPKLARKFTSTINIPVFTNDELANFAKVYAKESGYRIDNMGMLALYNLISLNQKEDEPMSIGAVKNMIDAAIAKSQGGKLFKKNASKKRMDRDGYIVLFEKDFAVK